MPLIGPLAAGAAMGLVISALGAGGSLFIVPVLVYAFGEPVSRATGTSLAVVFAAAAVGAIGHARKGHVRVRTALLFGGAAMAGAVLGARLHPLVSDRVILTLLAVTLLAAAARMALGKKVPEAGPGGVSIARILPLGAVVGVVTGFLGVGGGFVIVPVLVWGARLGLRDAIGTSLAVIAMSCAAGAAGHVLHGNLSAPLVLAVGGGAVLGALAGAPLSGKLPDRPIRLGFSALLAVMAVYMIVRSV